MNEQEYEAFLKSKHVRHNKTGFDVDIGSLNPLAFDWQKLVVQWALRTGRALLSEDCGLGKSFQSLMWAEQVVKKTGGKVILQCPLAVQRQFAREAEKFGIGVRVTVCESQDDVRDGITITNYEKLHHFQPNKFVGVVLDESQILRAYTGVTKRMLCEKFKDHPYKLACSATPAPNDRMEIGNQSEFLSVMRSPEMLQRWFINDGSKVGLYRLRKHGEEDFWQWMSSWAVCLSSPADLGFDATNYKLPPLQLFEHVIENPVEPGFLFNTGSDSISATNVHREKRRMLNERADVVAGLVNGNTEMWAVWCDTDYEADALTERIPDAIEVRGSMSIKKKEELLDAFTTGKERVIVTKPEIGGLGLCWEHVNNTTWFAGYSFEKFYQAIRRLYRFGQKRTVNVHLVRTENEGSICDIVNEKERQHAELQCEVARYMAASMKRELGLQTVELRSSAGTKSPTIPSWLQSK
jgi:hypothetical protein